MLLILPPHPFPPSHPWLRRFPWGGGGEWGFGPSRAECIKETNKTSMSVVVVVVFSVVKKMGRNGIFFLQFFFNFSISRKQMGVFFFFFKFRACQNGTPDRGRGRMGHLRVSSVVTIGSETMPASPPPRPIPTLPPSSEALAVVYTFFQTGESMCIPISSFTQIKKAHHLLGCVRVCVCTCVWCISCCRQMAIIIPQIHEQTDDFPQQLY